MWYWAWGLWLHSTADASYKLKQINAKAEYINNFWSHLSILNKQTIKIKIKFKNRTCLFYTNLILTYLGLTNIIDDCFVEWLFVCKFADFWITVLAPSLVQPENVPITAHPCIRKLHCWCKLPYFVVEFEFQWKKNCEYYTNQSQPLVS